MTVNSKGNIRVYLEIFSHSFNKFYIPGIVVGTKNMEIQDRQPLSLSGSQCNKEDSQTDVYSYSGCTLNNSGVAFHANVYVTVQRDE